MLLVLRRLECFKVNFTLRILQTTSVLRMNFTGPSSIQYSPSTIKTKNNSPNPSFLPIQQ